MKDSLVRYVGGGRNFSWYHQKNLRKFALSTVCALSLAASPPESHLLPSSQCCSNSDPIISNHLFPLSLLTGNTSLSQLALVGIIAFDQAWGNSLAMPMMPA